MLRRWIILRVSIVLLLVIFLPGCSDMASPPRQSDDESIALIKAYMQAQQAGDIEGAAAMFPIKMHLQWLDFLQKSVIDRGPIKEYVLESIEMNTVYSGKYYLATVRVTGAHADSLDIITAFRQVTEDQTYIVSHKIKIRR